jgi:hypothetical protein
VYLLRSFGNSAHEVWDVTDPAKPSRVVIVIDGLVNTHKNFWECDTGIAYVISGPKDWRTRRMTKIYYGRVLFVTFFNAGVRALDIRDPFNVKEIGYYIPATTTNTDRRCVGQGGNERCKVAIQSNNVEVDDRGYIYVVDRANTGMHVLELTGSARRVANVPGGTN